MSSHVRHFFVYRHQCDVKVVDENDSANNTRFKCTIRFFLGTFTFLFVSTILITHLKQQIVGINREDTKTSNDTPNEDNNTPNDTSTSTDPLLLEKAAVLLLRGGAIISPSNVYAFHDKFCGAWGDVTDEELQDAIERGCQLATNQV